MFSKKGFTLIELLIVVGIIGVLAALSIAVLNPVHFRAKARDANKKSALEQLRSELEMIRADDGAYPAAKPDGICDDCSYSQLGGGSGYQVVVMLECGLDGGDCSGPPYPYSKSNP